MALLEVVDIHTYYGDAYVLQGLSLTLEQGQILGLLGRNGVGKTTLVNSIMGFTPPKTCVLPNAAPIAMAGPWSGFTRCSRAWPNAATSAPALFRAASSRCWRSGAV